jgi:hypothetical protein
MEIMIDLILKGCIGIFLADILLMGMWEGKSRWTVTETQSCRVCLQMGLENWRHDKKWSKKK